MIQVNEDAQLGVPQVIHNRLVAIDYILVILLFGASMGSLESAVCYAEFEPFKTRQSRRA